MNLVEKDFILDGITYRFRIYQDTFMDSPREWDNLGTIVYDHPRYILGDIEGGPEDVPENSVRINIYAYEHGGIALSTSPFSDPWDSGQVGIIYAEKWKILRDFNRKRISVKLIRQVMEVLESEVSVFNQYINGDVYGYSISRISECGCCGSQDEELIDSCTGFYGMDFEDNGMLSSIEEKYRESVKKITEDL